MALLESNYTNVQTKTVRPTSDSRATPTYGNCYKLGEAVSESGQTASACSAEHLVGVYAGCGIQRITCGQRSIPSTSDAGFM